MRGVHTRMIARGVLALWIVPLIWFILSAPPALVTATLITLGIVLLCFGTVWAICVLTKGP
jgi:hypothetical protein